MGFGELGRIARLVKSVIAPFQARLENLELLYLRCFLRKRYASRCCLFEERNKLFTTRIYFLLVRNRLASYEKLVFVKTADWR